MVSKISTIIQMSHKHPVFEGQISRKKSQKSHANTLYDAMTLSLSTKKNRLWHRPPAALRGFHIQVTFLKLFTNISSKTCSEHVHNFSHTVPSTV